MNYWLDLFTGTTWKQFRDAGANISGFRESQVKRASKVQPGDILICYLTGVSRWVGLLKVVRRSDDQTPIWGKGYFPLRFEVEPLLMLEPENGVPMRELEGQVSFYESPRQWGGFKGFIRGSLNQFKLSDGTLVADLISRAAANPVHRPVDPKKLTKKPYYTIERKKGSASVAAVVTVPEREEATEKVVLQAPVPDTQTHTRIQYELLKLGQDLGLDLWVARNDRSRVWKDQVLGRMLRMVEELPTQFNEATTRTIELIDVLWLKGNSIAAAFEIECTTSVYSGLLRMSDLLALQPNLDINLFVVAPDDRRDKVEQEILRPTFNLREKPLSRICGFLSFNSLLAKIEGIRKLGLCASLSPTFLRDTAEYFGADQKAAAYSGK